MATITIASNGCPPLSNPTHVTQNEEVTFVNDCSRAANVTGLDSLPNSGNGKKLSNKPSLSLTPKDTPNSSGSITISPDALGTYNYDVSTCESLGGTAQMIVGENV